MPRWHMKGRLRWTQYSWLLNHLQLANADSSLATRLLSRHSQLGQHAATSVFPAAWQKDVDGQHAPPPQDVVPEGQVEDCNDQPWLATLRPLRGVAATKEGHKARKARDHMDEVDGMARVLSTITYLAQRALCWPEIWLRLKQQTYILTPIPQNAPFV